MVRAIGQLCSVRERWKIFILDKSGKRIEVDDGDDDTSTACVAIHFVCEYLFDRMFDYLPTLLISDKCYL